MDSIFTKIIKGEIPCYKVAEDENHLAFLDIMPLKEAHVLVITKKQVDYIFDLEPSEIADLNKFAQRVAKAIKKTVDCIKVGVAVIGLEVPHVHIHLIPLHRIDDINFSKPKLKMDSETLKKMAQKISEKFV